MLRHLLLLAVCVPLGMGCSETGKHSENIIVGIQPYEPVEPDVLKNLAVAIREAYGFNVVVLPARPMPPDAFVNIKSPRYRADKILDLQLGYKPDSVDYILGVASADISTTKRNGDGSIKQPEEKYKDWGVMGLGYRPGASCIVSSYRIRTPRERLIERITKIGIHEIGHNLGLDHCATPGCVMTDAAETINTVDESGASLCPTCRRKTQIIQ